MDNALNCRIGGKNDTIDSCVLIVMVSGSVATTDGQAAANGISTTVFTTVSMLGFSRLSVSSIASCWSSVLATENSLGYILLLRASCPANLVIKRGKKGAFFSVLRMFKKTDEKV